MGEDGITLLVMNMQEKRMKMKWQLPENGSIRYRTKFAWLPKLIDDKKVWLETYTVRQFYNQFLDKWVTDKVAYHE